MKTEEQQRNDMSRKLVEEIFDIFSKYNPPLGVAAYATSIVLVRIAQQANVGKKELIFSLKETWRQQVVQPRKKAN